MGSGQAGAFSDSIPHTDTITNGDSVNVGITAGSTTLVLTIIACTFTATNTANTITHMLSIQALASQPGSTGTFFSTPSGYTAYNTSSYNGTEANFKLRMKKAMAVNNFSTFVTGAGGGTLHSRINGSSATITCSLNVGSAQLVQDTTHTDNLSIERTCQPGKNKLHIFYRISYHLDMDVLEHSLSQMFLQTIRTQIT